MIKDYAENSDPKLRGHVATILGAFLKSSLRLSLGLYGQFVSKWTKKDVEVKDLVENVIVLSTDESHLVLRAVCTAAMVSRSREIPFMS